MEKYFNSIPSSSSSSFMADREEEDLLGRLGLSGYERRGGSVDCRLQLGLPGTSATPPPNVTAAPMQPFPGAHAAERNYVVEEVCTMCWATNTPLWRSGPYGPKSLCNACGIRYKKEEKRLTLSLGTASPQSKARRDQQKKYNFFKG